MKTLLHSSFLIVLASLLLSSCTLYKEVELTRIDDVVVKRFGPEGIEAEVTFVLKNPNWYRIIVKHAEVDVLLNQKPAGMVSYDERYVLPARSEEPHTLVLTGSLSDKPGGGFLDNLLNLLINREAQLDAEGYVEGRGLIVQRKFPIAFSEKFDLTRMNK